MGLFTKYVKIAESGILEGAADCHCHILPGVDDGVQKMEDSLSILDRYEKAGIRSVYFTPHVMEDIPNRPSALRQQFTDFTLAYKGKIRLSLASENMLDVLFDSRLSEGDLLALPGRKLLVETSYYSAPYDLKGILERVKSKGFTPLLAHPERYMYQDAKGYAALKDAGVLFQLNLPSLIGAYGSEVQEKAEKLLKEGMYDCFGTDLHRERSFEHLLDAKIPARWASKVNALPLKFQ